MRPRLLDLFCGAGGAAMGYSRAGFDVVGVDLHPQKNYPFEFHQADAMTYPLGGFDVIHASPPCQGYSQATKRSGQTVVDSWAKLIEPTRERLQASAKLWVIENVVHAPLINPIQLCGSSFNLRVRRHRLFESNTSLEGQRCAHAWQDKDKCFDIYQHGKWRKSGIAYVYGHNNWGQEPATWAKAMGIEWACTGHELAEAIPPAYTEFIGGQLMAVLHG